MDKNFYIFAGVNGSGKSTLYKTNFLNKDIKNSIRINTDEIVYSFGSWKNSIDQIKAGKIAIQLRNKCFLEEKSFNEETTLTGRTILKIIDKAKDLGYKIHLYYIGIDNPEIAKERVKNRIARGGHGISPDVIKKRYYESLKNLEKIIHQCDFIEIFDNSKKFIRIFYYEDNQVFENDIAKVNWIKNNLKELLNNL
ncbi:zeta toxin family protein [Fusobacterium animalis]|uniref:zeta toxin family protein n=1 Tax=Fusobacterium animalis TaxID=76859 RepID=UPI0034DFE30D